MDGRTFNRHTQKMVKGDINMCLLHTAMGKTLTLKHNVCTPCPYDRGNLYLGTKGIFRGIYFPATPEDVYEMGSPCQFGWIDKTDAHIGKFFGFKKAMEIRERYRHPFWRVAGEIAELSERSVNAGSKILDFPDYTRGGWKTAKPFTVDEIDISRFDFGSGVVRSRDAQTT